MSGYASPSYCPSGGYQMGEPPSTPTLGSQLAAPHMAPQATAVVEGRVRPAGEARSELREVDVRAAFAGLPKIKPHWTHK
jgi:hypothetical protein